MNYKKFYGYAITAGRIGLVGILAAILFRIALFHFGGPLRGLFSILHFVCLWAFYIGIPLMLIFGAIAAVLYFKNRG